MCGISGAVARAPIDGALRDAVARMNDALVHRGPDDSGRYESGHILLAMRRLSIIDLEGGAQPLYNEDRSVVLIMNGEIYNDKELREALAGRGHQFRTRSDAEAILHLYEDFGVHCVDHLRGMFAFALWDTRRSRLLLARDRMGEKPLYLFETGDELLFASELKALLRSSRVPFRLDPASVHLYFHYQYVPEPRTPVLGIRKLDAGTMLVVDTAPWTRREERYWRMEDAPPLHGNPAELIRAQLDDVTRIVTRADVPVGLALSGGIDSSAIAALVAASRPEGFAAFSVGYAGRPPSDERRQAGDFAARLRIPFHEVELTTDEIVESFPALNYWRDDPIADIAGFGYFAVMRAAREAGVPVMLQGQGADELFWGYPELRRAAADSLEAARRQATGSAALKLGRSLAMLRHGLAAFTQAWRRPSRQLPFYDRAPDYRMAAQGVHRYYAQPFAERVASVDAAELFCCDLPWPNVEVLLTSLICSTYLRENGVTQGDRLGMASSVELRLPFADHRLVETVVGLRKARSDSALQPKAWLKAAVRDVVPAEILDRPKRGFAPPIHEWHAALFARYGETLRGGVLENNGVLSAHGVEMLAGGPFPAGAIAPISFKALVLEQWCRQMCGLAS